MTITIPTWLGVVFTVFMAFIGGITYLNRIKFSTDKNTEDSKILHGELKSLSEEFHRFVDEFKEVIGTIKVTLAEQAILNNMSARTLETLNTRLEHFDKRLNENVMVAGLMGKSIEQLARATSAS